jgi:type VI secretion system secreted protein Hcp
MAIYLKYGDIEGDATHENHKKWFDIHSCQWGVGRAISTPVGSAANREASNPSLSEIVITKTLDKASAKLFEESLIGEGKKAEIHFITTGNPGESYLELVLTNTLISGYSVSSGGDRPTESLSLNFTQIELKSIPTKEDVTGGSPSVYTYDLATAKGK